MEKTNVIRTLDQKKINYKVYEYTPDETVGENVAKLIGRDAESTFNDKTKRPFATYRLRARRLLTYRYEEKIPHCYTRKRTQLWKDSVQRR